MGQRIKSISAILLKCAIYNLACAGQHTALGAEMAMPPRVVAMVSGETMLVATASQAAGGDMMAVQQTKNVDAPAAPTASALERRSISPLPSRKQRRRKPRMAGVPTGTPAVAQTIDESGAQAVAQETKRTDAPTKQQATVQKIPADDPFAPTKPQVTAQTIEEAETEEDPFAPTRPQTTAQKDGADDPFAPAKPQATAQKKASGKQYRMAPIRWRANVSEMVSWLYRTTSTSSSSLSSTSLQHTQTADINLRSYIVQPYIAQVGGGIGVASSAVRGGGSAGSGSGRSNSLYGDGKLSLFSRSRFPFSMSFRSTTASQTSSLPSNNDDKVGKSLGLWQEYRPLDGQAKYKGIYFRDNYTSTLNGDSSRTMLDGSYKTRLGSAYDQPFEARVLHTGNTSQKDGVLNTNILSARHIYLPPDSLLSLTSNASLTTTSQRNDVTAQTLKTQITQIATIADWQPESEDIPLFVTGGGRYYRVQTSTLGVPATQSLGGTVLANYLASSNLAYSADGSVAHVSSGATTGLVTTQGGRVSYRGNPVKLASATYSWNSHGGVKNQTGPAPDSGIFGSAGHVLAGDFSPGLLGKKVKLRYGVNQSLGVNTSRISGRSGTLVNGGTLAWSAPSGEMLAGGASLSVIDTRTFGTNPGHTLATTLNFGGTGQQGYGYKTSVYGVRVEADASIVALYSQQRDQLGNQYGTTRIMPSAKGSATYRKGGVFGVRRLVYSGTLRADVLPKMSYMEQRGAIIWRPVSYDLTQTLSYRIGMNEVRLVGNLNEQHNGLKNASIFIQFMAWRTIGN